MTPRPRPTRGPRRRPSLATLALIGICLAIGRQAPADAASASAPAAHAGHRCKCGMNCGTICCCAHERTPEPRPPERPAPAPDRPSASAPAGPCMTSAPCGGALPPQTRSVVRIADPADRVAIPLPGADAPGSLLPPPSSDRAWAGSGPRLDEPPERLADA